MEGRSVVEIEANRTSVQNRCNHLGGRHSTTASMPISTDVRTILGRLHEFKRIQYDTYTAQAGSAVGLMRMYHGEM